MWRQMDVPPKLKLSGVIVFCEAEGYNSNEIQYRLRKMHCEEAFLYCKMMCIVQQ